MLNKKPFYVIVTEDRYDMIGDPTSKVNKMKANLIKKAGGVSDTVAPGTYDFQLVHKGLMLVADFVPTELPN